MHDTSLQRAPTRLSVVGAVLLCALIAPNAIAAEPAIHAGEWEFVMKLDVADVAIELPEVRFKNCLSPSDPIPMQRRPAEECKLVRKKIAENSISYTIRCTYGQSVVEDYGKAFFRGDRMQGTLRQVMKEDGKVIRKTTAKMTGKRVGDCKQ